MARSLGRTLITAAALSLSCASAHAQTVEFRIRNFGAALSFPPPPSMDLVIEGRVTGASTPTGIAAFDLDLFFWGSAGTSSISRLRISNADFSYYAGAPTTSTTNGSYAGLAYPFRALVLQDPANNGVINPLISATGLTNTACVGELAGIRGGIIGNYVAVLHDDDLDGIPDTSPLNGSGQPVPDGSLAPLAPSEAGAFYGFGNFIQLYRFRFSYPTSGRWLISARLREQPKIFSHIQKTPTGWQPVPVPVTATSSVSFNFWEGNLIDTPAQADFCPPDFDRSGSLASNDIFSFLNAWFSACTATTCARTADYNCSGTLNTQDIFDFLNDWFIGCP